MSASGTLPADWLSDTVSQPDSRAAGGVWIVLPQHVAQLRRNLPALLEDDGNELTIPTRHLFHSLYEELVKLEAKIGSADQRIERAFQENEECQRIGAVEGIGPVTATAIVAAISDGHAFRNGRQVAAWVVGVWCRDSIPAEAKQNCWVSANAVIPICAHCWCMERDRWFIGPRLRPTDRLSQSLDQRQTTETERLGTARACIALANSPTKMHASSGP